MGSFHDALQEAAVSRVEDMISMNAELLYQECGLVFTTNGGIYLSSEPFRDMDGTNSKSWRCQHK